MENNEINLHPKYGYFLIHLYKPFYFPGEIVRGSIILDVFNPLPKSNKKVNVRFVGREYVGRHSSKIAKALK